MKKEEPKEEEPEEEEEAGEDQKGEQEGEGMPPPAPAAEESRPQPPAAAADASRPAAAAEEAMPKEPNTRGGTITRKQGFFKVHIQRKKSKNGKECVVKKKFGGKQTEEQAFIAAKAYIDERVP